MNWILLFLSVMRTNAAGVDPQALLEVGLFAFEAQVEAASSPVSCGNTLSEVRLQNFNQRVGLLRLIPEKADYNPGAFRSQDTKTQDFLIYLVNEYMKIEKGAMVHEAITDIDHRAGQRSIYAPEQLPGPIGRAARLLAYLRYQARYVGPDYEPAQKIFVDAFLRPEILKQALAGPQIAETRKLFMSLHDHNPGLYSYLLEKFKTLAK